jgi:TonB-dependent receptor
MAHRQTSVPTTRQGLALSAVALAIAAFGAPAYAQSADGATQTVGVTGFRASLESALNKKREEKGIVDVIKAEDISKFPDTNLAESLQRIPGVAIDREGGEGRTISVRGLNPDFTRVRINGIEGLSSWSDQNTPSRSRGFDFNIFASELFSEIMVRKTAAANIEEGSLGATVDLRTSRPFDFKGKGPVASASIKGTYNDATGKVTPRSAFLYANKSEDGSKGFLLSVAKSRSRTVEAGFDTVRWTNATTVLPAGFAAATAANGGNAAATALANNPNNFNPRFPRYGQFEFDMDRTGVTTSFQFKPTRDTTLTLDMLYSKLAGTREETWLEAPSFSRSTGGIGATSVIEAQYSPLGNLVYGKFNGVDIRTEWRRDELSSTFKQPTLEIEHYLRDDLKLNLLAGRSSNAYRNPVQVTTTLDAYNINGYTIDFRDDNRRPSINYGNLDVTKFGTGGLGFLTCPATGTCASNAAATGDTSLIRMRQMNTENNLDTLQADLSWDIKPDRLKLVGGLNRKTFNYASSEFRRGVGADTDTMPALPAGVNGADLVTLFTGYGKGVGMPAGTPTAWLVPNFNAIANAYGIFNNAGAFQLYGIENNNARANTNSVKEVDMGAYAMLDYQDRWAGMPIGGNLGVRYVTTDLTVRGMGTTRTGSTTNYVEWLRTNNYTDVLPSINASLTPMKDVVVRLAAAKTMARPTLASLNPATSSSTATGTGYVTVRSGNPFLDPYRANTFDAGVEYYFGRNSLLSLGVFRKDISSYIQTLVTQTTWSQAGLDPAIAGKTDPNERIDISQPINTPGGRLQGVELNYQQPFTFLPGIGRNFGSLISYTVVNSKINYVVRSTAASTTYTVDNLLGLSPKTWAATLYYEDKRLSGRVSVTQRAGFVSLVPAQDNNDVQGRNATTNVDASVSYRVDPKLTLTLEGVNLTNTQYDQFIGRARDNVLRNTVTGRLFMVGARYRF